ncbi:glycerophosphodiester phosphodiesterase family protein [Nocardioides sp. BP30]|uniref:glycerophosphodiester phosphodiesterase family protein n=1 Tax=Nocardioides sp. BP30 TaxID=3036374 RepID=UPI002468ECD2|nr:glycerophosphodiester phosphodiesterase family protein [Nocardioides sp. BP30]WGL52661.1 glycerophosphodiester phosphodiesterase family protein [Nocardioides sp. BP30]
MRPQVVAHRGASEQIAEHTLGAYVEALDVGAEGLECDIRLTSDGHLVCVHDRTLRRTAQTEGLVSEMTLSELEQLNFATWKKGQPDRPQEEPDRDDRLDRVLTLRTLLETVRDYDRRVELAIETKHPTRYGGLTERRLAELLAEFGWDRPGSPVRVMSFSYTALQRMERLTPAVPLVQLIDRAQYWPTLRRMVSPHWIIGPGVGELRDHPRFGRRLLLDDRRLHVWTVNEDADLEVCLDLGVEAVITDRPGYMLDRLSRMV